LGNHCTESPFAREQVLPALSTGFEPVSPGITPAFSPVRAHAPDPSPLTALVLPLYRESLQVAARPCWTKALPSVISANLSLDACTHTPVVPLVRLPVSSQGTSAFVKRGPTRQLHNSPYSDFRTGRVLGAAVISLCSGLQVCSPLRSLLPQCALTAAHRAAVASTSPHISVCYLPEQGIC
jgi:hypothetical protein